MRAISSAFFCSSFLSSGFSMCSNTTRSQPCHSGNSGLPAAAMRSCSSFLLMSLFCSWARKSLEPLIASQVGKPFKKKQSSMVKRRMCV